MFPSTDWSHLPIDLLLLVTNYASYRTVLRLTRVSRRLHKLVQQSKSNSTSRSSMWRRYPPVTVAVEQQIRQYGAEWWVVRVDSDSFEFKRRNKPRVSSLLCALQHVSELHLHFDGEESRLHLTAMCCVPSAMFRSLQQFKQLRSLEVRVGTTAAVGSLAAALYSLPSLRSLELDEAGSWIAHSLTAPLQRLCSSQLDHLTLTFHQLYLLINHQHTASMPHVRSLFVTPALLCLDWMGEPVVYTLDSWWTSRFPSLQHLTVCGDFLQQQPLALTQLPSLSSFTAHGVSSADLTDISVRTLCLRCIDSNWSGNSREQMCRLLTSAPRSVQQLSLSDSRVDRTDVDRAQHVFPPPRIVSASLSNLVYLDFIDGLTLDDWTYLLTPTSPPMFAVQLTHLALRADWEDRAAAAALLRSLLSMYPSLTHVHIGVQPKPGNERLAECAEWDEAVQAVRAAVGYAWCDSAADVLVCREDVAWRRSVGLPAQM